MDEAYFSSKTLVISPSSVTRRFIALDVPPKRRMQDLVIEAARIVRRIVALGAKGLPRAAAEPSVRLPGPRSCAHSARARESARA
ncbi:MAG: hypothetical protein WA975_21910 [Mesorhizobium sp.]